MGGTPLLVLVTLGVEFLFCNAGGTVGMVSTVLVAWLLGTAAGGSRGFCIS